MSEVPSARGAGARRAGKIGWCNMRRVGSVFPRRFRLSPSSASRRGQHARHQDGRKNAVPACVTPGRLIEYLKSRNPDLSPRFESVPVEYMRYGEKLGIRWDYAFYQMILETGALSYRNGSRAGDVKPTQNNFARPRRHRPRRAGRKLQGRLPPACAPTSSISWLYSGERLESPTAEPRARCRNGGC